MKKIILSLLCALMVMPAVAQQQEENQLNKEYQAAIREFLEQDIANRQRTMQKRAEQMLVSLPNDEKLYDETYISIITKLVDGVQEDGTPELNYVFDISYNCRHLEGWTDDYPLGEFDWDSSNSVRAICHLTKTFVEGVLDDIFRSGRNVDVKVFSTTDGVELIGVIPYDGSYGNFRYMPVTFNNEKLRISVDSTGITNNCQLAYIRAQSVKRYLETNVRNLTRTNNKFEFVTRSYVDTGAQYRRSSIELTVHDAFRETIELMTADKIQDEYVDFNIPQSDRSYENAFVVIIANDEYTGTYLPAVDYAYNDGEIMKRYFVRALGVPERQVRVLHNASKDAIIRDGVQWLTDIAQAVARHEGDMRIAEADFYVYYAGHGFTDFNGVTYIIPNDIDVTGIRSITAKSGKGCCKKNKKVVGTPNYDVKLSKKDAARFAEQCLAVDTLCAMLKGKGKRLQYPVSRLTVIVDASFDGNQRNGAPMLRIDRKPAEPGAKKARRRASKNSDAIVLMAADKEKTAYSFDAQHHGFLTYFLLMEIKGLGLAGQIDSYTYQDFYESVERKLSKESALQGKWQEITGYVDGKHAADWQSLKIR